MEAEFDLDIPSTLRRFFALPLSLRILLIVYGIMFIGFQIWFIWFINSVQ